MADASSPTPDHTEIVDEGSLHHYRTEIPNTIIRGIRGRGLSIYAKWLYVYLKSVAGDGGICYQSSRTLALESGLSLGQVHTAKQELAQARLITLTHGKNPRRDTDRMRIKDIWLANMQEFSVHSMNTDEEDFPVAVATEEDLSVHPMNTEMPQGSPEGPQCSPDGPQCSPHELGDHPMNTRRSPEEDPLKKKTSPPQTPPPAGEGPDAIADGEEDSALATFPPVLRRMPWDKPIPPAIAACPLCDCHGFAEAWDRAGTSWMLPCPHDSERLRANATRQGYQLVRADRSREPPAPAEGGPGG